MVVGVVFCETESLGASVAYLSEGKAEDMGDNAFGLNPSLVGEGRSSGPGSMGALPSSGGGVGVRGGTGSGILDAMLEGRIQEGRRLRWIKKWASRAIGVAPGCLYR